MLKECVKCFIPSQIAATVECEVWDHGHHVINFGRF
jgi:hypothetical protein